MRRWLRRSFTLPNILIALGIAGLIFELAHPSDSTHATGMYGVIGALLTLGGSLALDHSRTEDDARRRREQHAWRRRERLRELARLRRDDGLSDEARLLEELADDDVDDDA